MNTSTHTVSLTASKDKAFAFLADIENLPLWATMFCSELKRDDSGLHRVVTPNGEILFRIDADPATGVIDMYGGPTEEQMAYWPARVVDRPGAGSLFIFTAFQYPGMSNEEYALQCEGLEREFLNISRLMDD